MKYVVVDSRKHGDMFTTECATLEKAIWEADNQWAHMTSRERKDSDFYIIESVNEDEEADNHLEGDVVKQYSN